LTFNSLDLLAPELITKGSSTTDEANPDIIPSLQSANQRSLSPGLNGSLSGLSTYSSFDFTFI
jgi:hypothetical protein